MRKKKEQKLKNNIILSIKYARLLDERNEIDSLLASTKKKPLLGTTDNKLTRAQSMKTKVNQMIASFEDEHKPEDYLVDYNYLLSLLSKSNKFEYLKYQIAIEVVLEEIELDSSNMKPDFTQKVSYSLFDRKNVLDNIYDDYRKLEKHIYGTTFKSYLDGMMKNAVPLLNKLFQKDLLKYTSKLPTKLFIKTGMISAGAAVVFGIFKSRKNIRKLRNFGSGDLARQLIIYGLNIKYGKHYFNNQEVLYYNYTKYLFKEINLERKIITKDLFERKFEVEENKKKLEVLHNFDRYIIKEMDEITKEIKGRK